MTIFEFVENLRKKPEMTRRRILVGSTFSITAVIFVLWIVVRFNGFASFSEPQSKTDEQGPIQEAGQAISGFLENMKAEMASLGEVLSASTTEATTTSTEILDLASEKNAISTTSAQ